MSLNITVTAVNHISNKQFCRFHIPAIIVNCNCNEKCIKTLLKKKIVYKVQIVIELSKRSTCTAQVQFRAVVLLHFPLLYFCLTVYGCTEQE